MKAKVTAAVTIFIVAGGLVAAGPAAAQSYPNRLVKVVVPFAAGGGADVMARIIAQKLNEAWMQSVVVENRTGAGGIIGADAVAAFPSR